MARIIEERLIIQGVLVAETPLHVGGFGLDVDTDLPLARDGRGRVYVPGTSLAGALRGWCEATFDAALVRALWGYQEKDKGHASHLSIEDAPVEVPGGVFVEIRDGVGIDRVLGTAAAHIKYDRAVLPRGTRVRLTMIAEVPNRPNPATFHAMIGHLLAALANGEVRLGAAQTRGLGRVRLIEPAVRIQELGNRVGILQTLKSGGRATTPEDLLLAADLDLRPRPRLHLEIDWEPDEPVMVKAGHEGIAVDVLPLVSGDGDRVALVLPGSSIKGGLRAQAERIVRTQLGTSAAGGVDALRQFLEQLRVPLVETLFGSVGDPKRPHLGRAALAVDDCFAEQSVTRRKWDGIEGALDDTSLIQGLDTAGFGDWRPTAHAAIDRWTGGAADGFLYSVLEPWDVTWEPIRLDLDLGRLPDGEQAAALALLLLVLRDLAEGRLPLGFATERGMGTVRVRSVRLSGRDLAKVRPDLSSLDGLTLEEGKLTGLKDLRRLDGRMDRLDPPEYAEATGEGGMSEPLFSLIAEQHLGLAEALRRYAAAVVGNQPAPILLQAEDRCRFGRLADDGVVLGPDGQLLDLSRVYEARAFSQHAELRWLKGPDGSHRTALLSRNELPPDLEGRRDTIALAGDALSQTYLLWGEGTGNSPGEGWSTLAMSRIGGLDVPIPDIGRGQRVLLSTIEYLFRDEIHGNIFVGEERLAGLTPEGVDRG